MADGSLAEFAEFVEVADEAPSSGWLPDNGADVFRSFFERSGACVARLDRGMRVVQANPDFLRQFGRSRPDTLGRDLCELLHPDDRPRVAEQLSRVADDPGTRFAERVVLMRRGAPAVTGELTGFGVTDRNGWLDGVVVLVDLDGRGGEAQPAGRLLTEVDARILEGIGAGVSTVQLAATLYLSRGGVEYHVTTLLRRFKVKNRPALISKAYSMGIFRVGSWPPRVLPQFIK
ncbi:PAS domain-containing protein [Actinophytocola xanthii]|uniref:PAS domain-containing protein n=1 Tax=Actinophytocola xanthii TaxID=1912961 RepID=UPI0009F85ABC|nr:PAS domain-containing protein [Actinophytocola xanthii]